MKIIDFFNDMKDALCGFFYVVFCSFLAPFFIGGVLIIISTIVCICLIN